MKNIKTLFTVCFILASVTIATASNLFNTLRNAESNDPKNGVAVPASKPLVKHLERNINAKFIAKQLLKSASVNAILDKTSDVLKCYEHHISTNGTFFSNPAVAVGGSPTESFAIISKTRSERGDVVIVRVESNKDLQVYLNIESGLGVPFELMNLGENEVFLSPSYALPNVNYTIKLKSKSGERQLRLVVERKELLGKK